MWGRKKGRKEEDNPWRLLITHTGFYVYASSDLLMHFQALHVLFFFFFFFFQHFVFEISESLLAHKFDTL